MENNSGTSNLHDKLIDIELAKSNNNTKVRRYLPAVVLVAGFYYSALLTFGLALGYLGSKLFYDFFVERGNVDHIYIDCGKYKIHMHHWILGSLLLLLVWVIDYFYLPRFFVGVMAGVIAHDIYDFNDWHKILVRNEAKS